MACFRCANFSVFRLVSVVLCKSFCVASCFHCVVLIVCVAAHFRYVVFIFMCSSLFPLCCANFVELRLVSVVLC